jgi:hypothetical protein
MPAQGTRIPADASEVRSIVGDVDDATLSSILQTGATAAELIEALALVNADDIVGSAPAHVRRAVVDQVCELLQSEEPEDR